MKDKRQMIPLLVIGLVGVVVAIGFAVRDERERTTRRRSVKKAS